MAKGARKSTGDGRQGDLFAHADLFPVRQPEGLRAGDLSLRIKTGMGRAMKESPKSTAVLAAEISELTGRELSADALYAYTAPSKPEHDIGVTRFVGFMRATGAHWLLDVIAEEFGLVVLEGREAHFAQLGLLDQQIRQLQDRRRQLTGEMDSAPVQVSSRLRRRP